MAIDVERETDTGRFGTPLTEPKFRDLVKAVVPERRRKWKTFVEALQRDQVVTGDPAIGVPSMRETLVRTGVFEY